MTTATSPKTPVKLRRIDRAVGLSFHKISRFRGRYFDQILSPLGLTHAQVFVINHLLRCDGLTQVEIASRLDLGTVAISGLVDRLEAHEWVVRRPDRSDKRAKRVYLTCKARASVPAICQAITDLNRVSLAGLNEQEANQLVSLLNRVLENFGPPQN